MNEMIAKLGINPTYLLIILWIVIIYFMMVMPQKKRQKKQKELFNSLTVGAEVVTIGGIKGTIQSMDDDYVDIKVDKGVKLTMRKNAISSVINN